MRALSYCGFHSRAGWVVFKSFVRVYSVPSGIWLLMMKNQNTVLSYSKDLPLSQHSCPLWQLVNMNMTTPTARLDIIKGGNVYGSSGKESHVERLS